jgi:hypothetical protein
MDFASFTGGNPQFHMIDCYHAVHNFALHMHNLARACHCTPSDGQFPFTSYRAGPSIAYFDLSVHHLHLLWMQAHRLLDGTVSPGRAGHGALIVNVTWPAHRSMYKHMHTMCLFMLHGGGVCQSL